MTREELLAAFPSHRVRVAASLSRLVGPTEADDLANETLLRALSSVESFRGDAALGTWLHRIGHNLALDLLRRRSRDPVLPAPEDDSDASLETDTLEQRQMSECVGAVLLVLPARQRQLLIQADVQELTAAEIARDAGITPGNAKIRLHRARQALKSALEQRCEFHHRDAGVLCCTPKQDAYP